MTQIELLQAATPGKWIATDDWIETFGYAVCNSNQDVITVVKDDKANAELLRQSKVNALLVECASRGWFFVTGSGAGDTCIIGFGGKRWTWKGLLNEMPEEVFAAVLAELAGAK